MKKTLIALGTIFISFAAFTNANIANAQGANNVIAFADTKTFTRSIQKFFLFNNSVIAENVSDLNKVSTRAIKDFQNRFGVTANEKWYKVPDGFVSYFTLDGSTHRVFYDKKGRWQYTLRYYKEDKLPANIRASVRSIYYDYAITLVQEIQSANSPVYIVHIEDKTCFKNLRVSENDGISVVEEFNKK
jgi:hypothetical protein